MYRRRGFGRLLVAGVIALLGVFAYLSQRSPNVITGKVRQVSLTPQDEIALGMQAAPRMAEEFGGELGDREVDAYVASVGEKVARAVGAKGDEYPYRFHVLADSRTVNAFALPGGPVFVTEGLLVKLENEAQLAGVLAHEVGHVVARHAAEQLAKQEFTPSLVGAAAVASNDPQRPAMMAQAVSAMVNMRFGRQEELEADALGVRFTAQAGYDPRGMVRVMQILDAADAQHELEFFSTHPNPENRIGKLRERINMLDPGIFAKADGNLGADRFHAKVLDRLGDIERVRGTREPMR